MSASQKSRSWFSVPRTPRLLHEEPLGPQQRIGDEPDHRRHGHEHWVAYLPAEQDEETAQGYEDGQPVADGNPRQQHTCAQDGADGCGVGALDEPLHVRIGAVAQEYRRDDENEQERGQEDADGGHHRAPEARDQIAYERRGDNHRTRTHHPYRYRDEKVTLVQPAR